MTTTIVARVVRVQVGHSPLALVVAREEAGSEHKLELPVEALRNVSAGQILVLQWSVHALPELAPDIVVGEIVDAIYTDRSPEPSTFADQATPPASTATPGGRNEAMQLERALGIKPGALTPGNKIRLTQVERPGWGPPPSTSVDDGTPPAAATPGGPDESMQLERALGIRPGALSTR